MKTFQVIFSVPWPLIDGQQRNKVLIRANTMARALEVGEKYAPVLQITSDPDVLLIEDPRVAGNQGVGVDNV